MKPTSKFCKEYIARQNKHAYFMDMAKLVATRGTCVRRQVGCVLVNKRGHVLATGYNGVPSGMTHCITKPCEGAQAPSGTDIDKCMATHAEQNALLQCRDAWEIEVAYVTLSPCMPCIKMLQNTSCTTIALWEKYIDYSPVIWWIKQGKKVLTW